MKRIALAITIFLVILMSVCTHFFGNLWHLVTGNGYFIPAESNIFMFNPDRWNDGNGDWWLYGEDNHSYYGLNTEDTTPEYFVLCKGTEPEYFDRYDYKTWFPVRIDAEQVSVSAIQNDPDSSHSVKFNSKYWFRDFQTKEYKGRLAEPDFTGNPFAADKEYVEFITDGCRKNGINFGGHYTIIHNSCGCMCEHIFLVDRKSGKIHPGITPTRDDGDGKYGYRYYPDSKLLMANSGLFETSLDYYTTEWGVDPELYVWTGKKFRQLKDWKVDESYQKPDNPVKRLSFKNVTEILADNAYSTWAKVNDSTASLALSFDYDGAVIAFYSTECYMTFPCKEEKNKIVVYWDVDIDTKYNFDIVKAINQIDEKYTGQPFMILDLINDTTFKATYPLPELVRKINGSSTGKPRRTFFPDKYVIIQQGLLTII